MSQIRHNNFPYDRYFSGLILLTAGLVYLFWLRQFIGLEPDDTFISLRYAEHFVNGNGLVFNPGERVEGYSNLLWILMISPLISLGIPTIWAAKSVSLLAAAITLLITWRLAQNVLQNTVLAGAAVALLLGNPGFAFWSGSGLETAFYTLWLTTLVYLSARENPEQWWVAIGLAGAALALTRPEGVAIFGGLVVLTALRHWRSTQQISLQMGWALILGLLIIAAHYGWRMTYYGEWLPNSYFHKATETWRYDLKPGLRYGYEALLFMGGPFVIVTLGGAFRTIRTYFLLLLLLPFVAYGIFAIKFGGDWMPFFRFFLPIAPIGGVLLIAGVQTWVEFLWPKVLQPHWRSHTSTLLTLFMVLGSQFLFVQRFYAEGIPGAEPIEPSAMVIRLQAAIEHPDPLIVYSEMGMVPYFSGYRFLDDWGLTDATIARIKFDRRPILVYPHGPLPARQAEADSLIADYVLARDPDYFLLKGGWGDDGKFYPHHLFERAIFAHPVFAVRYTFSESLTPGVHFFSRASENR